MGKTEMGCDCTHIDEELVRLTKKNMPDDELIFDLAEFFKVFADSTSMKILWALHENELCVCHIARQVLGCVAACAEIVAVVGIDLLKTDFCLAAIDAVVEGVVVDGVGQGMREVWTPSWPCCRRATPVLNSITSLSGRRSFPLSVMISLH